MASVVLLLIVVNAIVFFLPNLSKVYTKNYIVENYGMTPNAVRNGEYYRFVSAQFVHFDLMHFFLNMYSLYILGSFLVGNFGIFTAVYGPMLSLIVFLLFYLMTGIGGYYFSHLKGKFSVGASGAIFGMFGFIFVLALSEVYKELLDQLLIVLAINIFIGFTPGSRIDNWGHLGGFLSGIIFGVAFYYLYIGSILA